MNLLLKPFLKAGNAVVRRLLGSRLHWLLSGNVVLLRLIGRKSGRMYLVPVNYRQVEGGISVMTYRRRQWWRNIRSGEDIQLHFRGKLRSATPEVITEDIEAISEGLLDRGWVRKSVAPARARESVLIRLHLREVTSVDQGDG